MNRFLKKEWEDTEIAPEILWRTRNQAWQRLQKRRRYRIWPIAAALASLSALLLAWVSFSPSPLAPRNESAVNSPQPAGLAQTKDRPAAALVAKEAAVNNPRHQEGRQLQKARTFAEKLPAASPEPLPETASIVPGKEAAAAQPDKAVQAVRAASDSQRPHQARLVMNFRLPRSGVRMIWINQKTSDSTSGGTG